MIVIEPGKGAREYWKDLWRYRELLFFLTLRDILVRYKQTTIGISWAFLRPFLTMVVFTVVFGKIANLPSGGVPYALLVCAAILPWQFFSSAVSEASNSLVANSNLVTKVYFPRLILPLSGVIASVVDLLISAALLAGLMVWYGVAPSWRLLTLPLFTGLAVAIAIAGGLWLSALNVRYRDFRYALPFVLQFGLYISPVGFSSSIVSNEWRLPYSVNPMVAVIDGFRWAILSEGAPIYWPGLVLSLLLTAALLASGLAYFRKAERRFADDI